MKIKDKTDKRFGFLKAIVDFKSNEKQQRGLM